MCVGVRINLSHTVCVWLCGWSWYAPPSKYLGVPETQISCIFLEAIKFWKFGVPKYSDRGYLHSTKNLFKEMTFNKKSFAAIHTILYWSIIVPQFVMKNSRENWGTKDTAGLSIFINGRGCNYTGSKTFSNHFEQYLMTMGGGGWGRELIVEHCRTFSNNIWPCGGGR